VRERCVFTTHTPVDAGHDRFGYDLVGRLLGDFVDPAALRRLGGEDALNMTRLALNLSGYINGVAERHQETAARMFPGYPIRAITNGVHPASWTHPPSPACLAGSARTGRMSPNYWDAPTCSPTRTSGPPMPKRSPS
jgi:glucan phosphorylase